MSAVFEQLTDVVAAGRDLSRAQSADAFSEIMQGGLPDDRIAAFLAALADKGETVDEIVGAARVMRRHATPIKCEDSNAVDTCGTGGDGISTFNVSTAAAIVAAAAGARVAKHGNRTNTRKSGSAEALAALGVNIEAPPHVVEESIREVGIGFLFAAQLHPAMKHAAPARKILARRTIFNILGPLTNPAGVRRQIVGVPRPDLLDMIAGALRELGTVRALVVNGEDGLCDFTVTGRSRYVELLDGELRDGTCCPEDVGLHRGEQEALCVDSPAESAAVIRAVLSGAPGAPRDHTLLNAAAALVTAGTTPTFRDGVDKAARAIDSGAAQRTLDELVRITQAGGRDA
ncbi:MAG: anthranilate phosphoribosyltransferase [Planctomycetota bacterium]